MTTVCAVCGAPRSNEQAACPSCGDAGKSRAKEDAASTSRVRVQPTPRENLVATLAYLTAIPALVLLCTRPYRKNQFVRFHALQSIALAASTLALMFTFLLLANLAAINLLLIPVALIAGIGIALLVIVCMIKAYQHRLYKLPVLGEWVERHAIRS
ncbi:MAG: hypothetical protein JO249_08590 [Acidobacteria bacterium]|nr:hypothetical protein [Acidobacteriota bacterium]